MPESPVRAHEHHAQWEKLIADLAPAAKRDAIEHRAKQLERSAPKAARADLSNGGRNKVLHKAVRGLGDEIADAILKGQRRQEKGRFVPGSDGVHSHKMGKEIVTHAHDGEKGHTHPSREYGPSYHHR